MKLLFVIFAALAASVVAIDEDEVWTEDMVNDMITGADMSDAYLNAVSFY